MKCRECGKSFVFIDSEICLSCQEDAKEPKDWMYKDVKRTEREALAE